MVVAGAAHAAAVDASYIPPYPAMPSAAAAVPVIRNYPLQQPDVQQEQQLRPTPASQFNQQQVQPHPISVGSAAVDDDDDDDGWGVPADDDDWGTAR